MGQYNGFFRVLLIAPALLGAGAWPEAAQAALINVTTTADEYDSTPNATCSLREAIRTANDNADFGGCTHTGPFNIENIFIPAGTYVLTRAGIDEDLNATADLDVTSSLNLNGNSAATTTIQGGTGYSGRILHVLSGTVTVQNMTIRDGNVPNGRAGGGVRTEPGSTTTMFNVVVGLNTADGNAGGILNRGTMTLNSCAVTNNQTLNAVGGGGGIFNSPGASLTINDGRILNNETLGDPSHGGGIHNDAGATLELDNTTIDGNIAGDPGVLNTRDADGGGIYSLGNTTIDRSTIGNNRALRPTSSGGGIGLAGGAITRIDRSLVTLNEVRVGGGISDQSGGSLIVENSAITDNLAEASCGGIAVFVVDQAIVRNSTISGNSAEDSFGSGGGGGGICSSAQMLILENTTISNNSANDHGGGMKINFGDALLLNVTIANNTSNADGISGGSGGGLFVVSGNNSTVALRNSVLAGNLENNVGDHDDCDGVMLLQGHNLIQNTSGCTLVGSDSTDKLGVLSGLGTLADNGGPTIGASNATITATMPTHLPVASSPLIDAANPQGCTDANAAVLATDQRGLPRHVDGPDPDSTATCDIGATEFGASAPLPDPVFANGFE